jgi:hypothetical protein
MWLVYVLCIRGNSGFIVPTKELLQVRCDVGLDLLYNRVTPVSATCSVGDSGFIGPTKDLLQVRFGLKKKLSNREASKQAIRDESKQDAWSLHARLCMLSGPTVLRRWLYS